MKQRLFRSSDKIIVTEANRKPNVVIFWITSQSIIIYFHSNQLLWRSSSIVSFQTYRQIHVTRPWAILAQLRLDWEYSCITTLPRSFLLIHSTSMVSPPAINSRNLSKMCIQKTLFHMPQATLITKSALLMPITHFMEWGWLLFATVSQCISRVNVIVTHEDIALLV